MISGDLYWPTTDKPPEVAMKSEARKEAEKLGANAIVGIRVEAYENSCLKITRWDANPGDANATSKGSQECIMLYGTAILIEE